jgi:hypothetical protein
MKSVITQTVVAIVLILTMVTLSQAAVPLLISYQGHLTDAGGQPLADGNYQLSFGIFTELTGGTSAWSSVMENVEVASGSFSVLLDIPDEVLADSAVFLEVAVGAETLEPRSRLVSVPYAYRIGTIDGASGGVVGGLVIVPEDFQTLGNAITILDANGAVQLEITVDEANETSVSIYDPIDFVAEKGVAGRNAVRSKKLEMNYKGVTMFGLNTNDTTAFLSANGDIQGRGKIRMGPSSSGSGAWSTVFGFNNQALADSSTISGGFDNSTGATAFSSVIGGGGLNFTSAAFATVGGGVFDTASATDATVGGGRRNTASGSGATVGGGQDNRASGWRATIPGGYQNLAAGNHSFAAGSGARARHNGSFVLAATASTALSDSVYSGGVSQMVLRADGGFYLTDGGGAGSVPTGYFLNTSTGAYLSDVGIWENNSDVNTKTAFEPADFDQILDRLDQLEVQTWTYRKDEAGTRHIGPTAQDFHATFGYGSNNRALSTLDVDGVALAALKALLERNKLLEARLQSLEKLVAGMAESATSEPEN